MAKNNTDEHKAKERITLVTFQSLEALKDLIGKGYLECDETKINMDKSASTYSWILDKMNEKIENPRKVKYPIWCWVRCYSHICPPKHKGDAVPGFDVKITFKKQKKDIFITDFRRYSFLLNNIYIPSSINEKKDFDREMKKMNITRKDLKAFVRKDQFKEHRTDKEYLAICKKIKDSFDQCITEDSDILQGCVWRIELEEIDKIEFLNDKNYRYGSLNYIRSDGTRKDWIKDFYNKLK